MFPLATRDLPADSLQLAEALNEGLATVLVPAPARQMVTLEAAGYPEAERLEVDLTGCQLIEEAAQPPKKLHGFRPALSAERFVLSASPLIVRSAGVRLEISASAVRFDYARDDEDRLFLIPSVSQEGEGEKAR